MITETCIRMWRKFSSPAFFFSVLSIAIIFFLAPIDTDLGWHLRYGDYFWQTGSFLTTNKLTYFLPGYLWPNSYTLYQIIVSAFYKFGGLTSLTLLYSFLAACTFLIFDATYPKFNKINYFSFLFVVLFGWSVFRFGLRAQIYSFVFLILLNFLIKKDNFKAKLFIPVLFLLWVNTHGAFVVGFILLGTELVRLLVKKDYDKFRSLLLMSAISLGATLINPYGIKIYEEVLRHAEVPMKSLIAEWVEPPILFKLAITLFAATLGFLILHKDAKKKVYLLLPLLAFSYLGYSARRNLGLASIGYIFVVYELVAPFIGKLKDNTYLSKTYILLTFLILVYFSVSQVPTAVSLDIDWVKYCNNGMLPYPYKAVEYIKREAIPGENVFSSYEWGGFLEWQLPEYKFFVDGRTPAWPTPEGKSPYTVYLEIIQAQPGYEELLKLYDTDWMLVPANTYLDIELTREKKAVWKEVYRDEISAIYLKQASK